MPLYRWNPDNLEPVPATTFESEQILEEKLRTLLRDQPEVLEEGLFIIAEEFSNWQDSGRSIDLLALDGEGNLVVIELKRTQTGDHSELQAIRYAAMVANMTFEQIVEAHRDYLTKRGVEEDARERVLGHLEATEESEADVHTESPRIILASAGFSKELTTSVLWLRDCGMNLSCVKLQLYRSGKALILDTSLVIPLPEAAEYQVQIRRKKEEERDNRNRGRLIDGGDAFRDLIPSYPAAHQEMLYRLYQWAANLEEEGLCALQTYVGVRPGNEILLPRISPFGVGLMNFYNTRSGPRIQLFRSVYERHAPKFIERIEELVGNRIGQGTTTGAISDGLLEALTDAYREANGLPPTTPRPGSGPDSPPPAE